MKSYNRKDGVFNLQKFDRLKNLYINKNPIINTYFIRNKTTLNTNRYSSISDLKKYKSKGLFNNYYSKNLNTNKKKRINININNGNSFLTSIKHKNYNHIKDDKKLFFTTSISTNIQTREINKENDNIKKVKKEKNKISMKYSKNKFSSKKIKPYFSAHYSSKSKSKKNFLPNFFHPKNIFRQKNNIISAIEDSKNPYSINYTRKFLQNNYNMDIFYNKFTTGVPVLTLRQMTSNRINTTTWGRKRFINEIIRPKERMAKTSYNTLYSGFKVYSKNKKYNNNNRYYRK